MLYLSIYHLGVICRLPDTAWIVAWILLTALLAYMVLVSVMSSDLDKLTQPGMNSKSIACGSSPHAAISTLVFFSYTGGSFSQQSCVVECPIEAANLTVCSSTMVSTACAAPPCEVAVPCEDQQTHNVTVYATQQVLQYCVPDPDTGLQSQFASTAKRTFGYEVSPPSPTLSCCLAVQTHLPCVDRFLNAWGKSLADCRSSCCCRPLASHVHSFGDCCSSGLHLAVSVSALGMHWPLSGRGCGYLRISHLNVHACYHRWHVAAAQQGAENLPADMYVQPHDCYLIPVKVSARFYWSVGPVKSLP